jgi:Adaptive response protein AidB N-terminal domain
VDELALEAGSGVAREHGRLADLHPPVLHAHDRYGGRIDEVEFHPSWHGLLRRAGRIRCARQHDDRDAGRWRRMSARRAQVVHLSTNERRFPRARLRPRWTQLLRGPPRAARRHPQRHPAAAAEEQAGQPGQCLCRDRVRRRPGLGGRRGGPWVPTIIEMVTMTRLGLRDRLCLHHACGAFGGCAPCGTPPRVRGSVG